MAAVYRFEVYGRVQGVGFRQATQARAAALGLDGWVRNRADGAVEGLATGSQAALDAFADWLREGPPSARVEQLQWRPAGEPVPGSGFRVRRGD